MEGQGSRPPDTPSSTLLRATGPSSEGRAMPANQKLSMARSRRSCACTARCELTVVKGKKAPCPGPCVCLCYDRVRRLSSGLEELLVPAAAGQGSEGQRFGAREDVLLPPLAAVSCAASRAGWLLLACSQPRQRHVPLPPRALCRYPRRPCAHVAVQSAATSLRPHDSFSVPVVDEPCEACAGCGCGGGSLRGNSSTNPPSHRHSLTCLPSPSPPGPSLEPLVFVAAAAMASMFEQPQNGTLFLGGQKISGPDIRDQNGTCTADSSRCRRLTDLLPQSWPHKPLPTS